MTRLIRYLAAAAAVGGIAVPAAAQAPYPYQYPQQAYPQQGYAYPQQGYAYPQQGYAYPQQGYAYPQQGYGYPQQGYGYPQQQQGYGQNVIGQMINQLLGNRYSVTDRTAVQRCASAAAARASAQYRHNPYSGYRQQGYAYGQQGYAYGQQGYHAYNPAAMMRVTAITSVQRRSNGVRVSGLLDTGAGTPPYGQAYGYHNRGHAAAGDLAFRCNVDYRGAVTNVRIRRNTVAYRR